MFRTTRTTSVIALLICVTGCAAHRTSVENSAPPSTRPISTTRPHFEGDSALSLDDITPSPRLTDRATTSLASAPATTEPSLDAIELYARARGAIARGDRRGAVTYLERAAQADPGSFQIRYELGRAYGNQGADVDKAIAVLLDAERINPDDADLQLQLGRLYLGKDDVDNALLHLRLAMQTAEYGSEPDTAAIVDFYLARALQQKGYDRAAIDRYEALLRRLQHDAPRLREKPESAALASRPDSLFLDLAQLYEKHGLLERALPAYALVANKNPENFDVQTRLVNTLVATGRGREAVEQAQHVVEKFKASNESLALLRDTYRKLGREGEMAAELRRLHEQRPFDRAILFSLADTLDSQGRRSEAADLLGSALSSRTDAAGSIDIARKLFTLYESHDDTAAAARVLITYLADHPDATIELSPLWDSILRIGRKNPMRLATLQKLDVPPRAVAAKLFWVSRVATIWSRDALAKSALDQAVKQSPIYPPAHRAQIAAIWRRADWDDAKKTQASEELIASAQHDGNNAFAEELRGLLLFNQKKPAEANKALGEAIRLGDPAPDVQLAYAESLRDAGETSRFENLVWKLITDRPGYDQAYATLFQHYLQQASGQQARKVLSTWLGNDPNNVGAKLLHASVLLRATGRPDATETLLLDLLRTDADNPEVLANARAFYGSLNQLPKLTSLLEAERKRHPDNRVAIEQLVDIYVSQKQLPEALRVLDDARATAGRDPDLLYYFAHLYERVEQKETCEQMLEEVLTIDPRHAAANNDLGYMWTDDGDGRKLDRAEQMIRIALEEEPDNESFLDSLGWVLYKRGKFAEARDYFTRAVEPASFPDPVVLDHLGDTLYRLDQPTDARRQWQRATDRLKQMSDAGVGDTRSELTALRLSLQQKLKQLDQKQEATVAPIAAARVSPADGAKE